MYVIVPRSVTDSNFESTIPEPDIDAGEIEWSAYTAAIGDERVVLSTHRRYKALAATTDDPVTGAAKTVPTWLDIAPTNRWALFDNENLTQSFYDGGWSFDYTPGGITQAVAGFNITGVSKIVIVVNSSALPEPWEKEIDMFDNSEVVDYWTWSFLPLSYQTEFIITDMPFYYDAEINVEFVGSGRVAVGSITFGSSNYLGDINYGTSFKLLAAGVDEDSAAIKLVDYKFTIRKNTGGATFRLLQTLLKKPAVYYATLDVTDGSMVLGYYVDSNISIDTPIFCPVSLSVKGVA